MLERWLERIGRWFRPSGRVTLGPMGERIAAEYLQKLGYRILARGHRQKLGEIDLIALDGSVLVFVEVKTWSQGIVGESAGAVNQKKQERLTRAALIYLKKRGLLEHPSRFDVIAITILHPNSQPEVRHFKNAFEAVGHGQMFR